MHTEDLQFSAYRKPEVDTRFQENHYELESTWTYCDTNRE
jgi:hypothetical protein